MKLEEIKEQVNKMKADFYPRNRKGGRGIRGQGGL